MIKYLFIFVMILAAIIFSFIGQGDRFTAQDGMVLYQICQEGKDFSDKDIKTIYGEKDTVFKQFLLDK